MNDGGRSATVVPKVEHFRWFILLVAYPLLVVNLFGFANFAVNLNGFAPGIGTGTSVDQVSYMLAGRQLAVALVFALGLFSRRVRLMQLGWGLAIIREFADMAGTIARGQTAGALAIAALVAIEVAIFVYLGALASGRAAAR
ncbi:MAG: hypothetical protein ACRD1K_15805 [Acidimicrobiales bacterium]